MENLKALVYKGDLTPYQRALAQREFKDLVERLELLEKAVKNNTVLPLVGRSFSPGQKIKVELEDGTVWNSEVSDENTVIIDCTPEYMSYYEWNYGGGNEFPTSIDNEYQFEDVKVLGVL